MKHISKILSLLLFLTVSLSVTAQQTRTISGIVYDEANIPVIGANITVPGLKIGVVTDWDGKFTLSGIPSGNQTIQVSYLGYKTQTVNITSQTDLTITMELTDTDLGEVVIVGYGAQKKAHLTGSVATVTPSEITDLSVTSLATALEGMITGVSVNSTSNRPGEPARIVIRSSDLSPGAPSSSAGLLVPLYVIDDYIADETAFNNLDANMIYKV